MIIDSHRHIAIENRNFTHGKEIFLSDMRQNNIDKAIVIADNVSDSDTADTPTLLSLFSNEDNIKIIGSFNPFSDQLKQQKYFNDLLDSNNLIGLKLFNGFDQLYPTDKRCFNSYHLALKYNVPVIFHTGINVDDEESAKYNDPKYIVEIAKKFPRLKIIIAHFFWPEIEYCLEMTKDIPNIYMDTTVLADKDAIVMISKEKIQSTLEKAVAIKPDKIIFGSDFPACQTTPAVNLIKSLNISDKIRNNIFYYNVKTLFNI